MVNIIYYYVSKSNPYKILSTGNVDELITLLYEDKAEFISDGQRIGLGLSDNYIDTVKKDISKNTNKIPLYDIRSNHIFLIYWENVYQRIYLENYRFVDENFYSDLKNTVAPTDLDLENLRLLSYYDFNTLNKTYLKIFYKSFVVDSFITNCRRPSFYPGMDHISPYYSINEINYLAHDWNLTNKITYDAEEIAGLCKKIVKYDIPAKTLIDHQLYIYDSKAIGLVKYYSLSGSYYMNVYLRKSGCCLPIIKSYDEMVRNLYLENEIKIMIKLIKNAPAFTIPHTVYRFVERDDYLQHLEVGDVYQDTSFMSTTRNPYYYKENYAFGLILIKIKIPAHIKGIGLCIEAYSNFPNEEEIILCPASKYKLENISETVSNIEFHNALNLQIQKKYEFTWIGNSYIDKSDCDIKIEMPGAYIPEIQLINLSELLHNDKINHVFISDRLKYFQDNYVNINNQFDSIIGKNRYTFNFNSYDSTTVYNPFFYYEVKDGIMLTTANPKYGNINLLMEIGTEIHINYYFRYSVTDLSMILDLNRSEWIEWLSMFAYVIGSRSIVIHSNYTLLYDNSDTIEKKIIKTKYTFSQNIYIYMKHQKKLYEFREVVPHFDYFQLDRLKDFKVEEIITSTDKNELYRLAQISKIDNIYDFYLYIVENFPKLVHVLESKMSNIYEPHNNPFLNIQYSLDAWLYLYNHNFIPQLPSDKDFTVRKGSFKKLVGDKKIPKFKNRLRTYLFSQKKNRLNPI
jgi:hypothetical protein